MQPVPNDRSWSIGPRVRATKETPMTFRNLLVHLDPSKSSLKRADVAIGLAAAQGAHLTALAAVPAPLMPSYATAEIPTSIYARIATYLDDDTRATAAAFIARPHAPASDTPEAAGGRKEDGRS